MRSKKHYDLVPHIICVFHGGNFPVPLKILVPERRGKWQWKCSTSSKKNIRYIGQWFDPFQQNLSAITKCLLQRGLILKLKELLTKQSNEENMRSGNI